jgi:hypothetical protein
MYPLNPLSLQSQIMRYMLNLAKQMASGDLLISRAAAAPPSRDNTFVESKCPFTTSRAARL